MWRARRRFDETDDCPVEKCMSVLGSNRKFLHHTKRSYHMITSLDTYLGSPSLSDRILGCCHTVAIIIYGIHPSAFVSRVIATIDVRNTPPRGSPPHRVIEHPPGESGSNEAEIINR